MLVRPTAAGATAQYAEREAQRSRAVHRARERKRDTGAV